MTIIAHPKHLLFLGSWGSWGSWGLSPATTFKDNGYIHERRHSALSVHKKLIILRLISPANLI
ncbi:MAG: hypothetical protein QS721_10025 [Candidatus Endonucleobacter sp. (ex Gigantidas childressi)]|nr:hypothetical protein [Candidatus Endonucleobacter sp. (ex Gigantidas childressi)]